MINTTVRQVCLTVSTVEVFAETMKKLTEENLWDDAVKYLKSQKKTELFVDLEALGHLHDHLEKCGRSFDGDEALLASLYHHTNPLAEKAS